MIIDGGVCKIGVESTVIDLTGHPKILREGGLSSDVIEKFLKNSNTGGNKKTKKSIEEQVVNRYSYIFIIDQK